MSFLWKPLSFLCIICGGYLLTRAGFFQEGAHREISKVVLNITLPAAIISAFGGFRRELALFLVVLFGLLCSLLPMLAAYGFTRGLERSRRAFTMLNVSGYNIGCFTLPLIESFFGPTGVVVACMFDVGNAVVVTGGSYALVSTLLHTDGGVRETPRMIARKFLTSVPFDTYMILLALAAAGIPVPDAVLRLTAPAAAANTFLSMLMLGMMFRPQTNRVYLKDTAWLLTWRLLFGACFSLLLFWCAPFSLEVRQILAVVVFAPVSALAPVYTERCRGDGALASFAGSISIFIGIVVMTSLVYLMGVALPV